MSDYDEPNFDIDIDINDDIDDDIESIISNDENTNSEYNSDSESEIEELIDDDNNETTQNINQSTLPRLTKYEYVSILGTRAQQIARGAKIFVSLDNIDNITPINIAKKEFEMGKIPLKSKRILPNGNIEYIRILKKLK